jgi:hypothetical protein
LPIAEIRKGDVCAKCLPASGRDRGPGNGSHGMASMQECASGRAAHLTRNPENGKLHTQEYNQRPFPSKMLFTS